MKQVWGLVAAAVLSAGILTGCADSSQLADEPGAQSETSADPSDPVDPEPPIDPLDPGDYCATLEGAVEQFSSLEESDFAQFDEALETFRTLADQAPSEVEEQWQVLVGAIDELEQALEEAGVSFSDLEGLATGQIPEGVDEAALLEALSTLEELDQAQLDQATTVIEEHALSECGVTLPE